MAEIIKILQQYVKDKQFVENIYTDKIEPIVNKMGLVSSASLEEPITSAKTKETRLIELITDKHIELVQLKKTEEYKRYMYVTDILDKLPHKYKRILIDRYINNKSFSQMRYSKAYSHELHNKALIRFKKNLKVPNDLGG